MFKNDRNFGKPTGAILDSLGLRGYRIGDAAISPFHANIFVNLGSAKAADMRTLIDYAADKAYSAYGFKLQPEVRFIGVF
jgi:UDP-N-acetylmuramate dehydrogenase